MRKMTSWSFFVVLVTWIFAGCSKSTGLRQNALVPTNVTPPQSGGFFEDPLPELPINGDTVQCAIQLSAPQVTVGEIVTVSIQHSEGAVEVTINNFPLDGKNSIALRAMRAGTFRIEGRVSFENGMNADCFQGITIVSNNPFPDLPQLPPPPPLPVPPPFPPAPALPAPPAPPVVTRVPIHRFFNGRDHFYTLNYDEGVGAKYAYEGVAVYASKYPVPGAHEIFRCYVPSLGDHFISVHANCEGQNFEGSLGWLRHDPNSLYSFRRMMNLHTGDHFYTLNQDEYRKVMQTGHFRDEGEVGAGF